MRGAILLRLVLAVALAAFQAIASAQVVTLRPFASGLTGPVEITHAGDGSGRLYVVEQPGRIRIVEPDGRVIAQPFLDITPLVKLGDEQGLLGLAFHPRHAQNGFFYVYYTAQPANFRAAGSTITLARYTRSTSNSDMADPASAQVILTIAHDQFANHNGGKIAFGADGYLYLGVGDGGGGGNPLRTAQNLADLRGKILRIDVDGAPPYAIPPTNPFVGRTDARGEVFAYGLRNPWRFSFDPATGDAFVADVGQDEWEEVDHVPAGTLGGRNIGWSTFEGTHCFDPPANCTLANATLPVIEYGHDASGGQTVIGGYRYRGRAVPQLFGQFIYGDFLSNRIWAAAPGVHGNWRPVQVATFPGLSTFGEDAAGELYAASVETGDIVRIVAPPGTDPSAAPEANALRRWLR